MDHLWVAVKTLGIVFVMTLIVPLMVWGGTGNWRHAFTALRKYWLIVGGAVALVGGLAVALTVMEFIG